jgi:hypothetical protein
MGKFSSKSISAAARKAVIVTEFMLFFQQNVQYEINVIFCGAELCEQWGDFLQVSIDKLSVGLSVGV